METCEDSQHWCETVTLLVTEEGVSDEGWGQGVRRPPGEAGQLWGPRSPAAAPDLTHLHGVQ